MHVYCLQGEYRGGERFARHWYDLTRIQEAGIVDEALKSRSIAEAVAEHKGMFLSETDRQGKPIDYQAAVSGALQLVPEAEAREVLNADYQRMVDEGMFFDDPPPFETLVENVQRIQDLANSSYS